ncbi:hypothetical protein [Sphingobium subterraneum]|uniref:Lipoprotein n=1 Tax=Sphingobium subterraneum TaxID=627688 RepID=A0A841IZ79_9SPHN|nr:hypothetical protein [Sphingobium subterraneum]MBB6123640.1 hypothetical protein [Sphingobium subterraneum]
MTDPRLRRTLTRALLSLALLAVPACSSSERQNPADPSPAAQSGPNTPPPSELEQAALQSGAIVDARRLSPIGLYRNRHEAGTDTLCVVPDTDKPSTMRFGMEAMFGESAGCSGHGTVRRAGDRLIFHFARSTCLIVAGYEGDRVVLPGALDLKCNQLCTNRGSLEGVSFPRVARDVSVGKEARRQTGKALCTQE